MHTIFLVSKKIIIIKYTLKIILRKCSCIIFPHLQEKMQYASETEKRQFDWADISIRPIYWFLKYFSSFMQTFWCRKQTAAGKHYSFRVNETRSDCLFAAWKTERQNKRNQVASGFMVSRQLGLVEGCLDLKAAGPCGYPSVKHPIDWTAPPGQKQLQCFS